MTESFSVMHQEAASAPRAPTPADDSRRCAYCHTSFLPRRKWARFCSAACRTEANARSTETGVELKVASMRVLKGGTLSLVVRVPAEHRHQFESVAPGASLKVVRP